MGGVRGFERGQFLLENLGRGLEQVRQRMKICLKGIKRGSMFSLFERIPFNVSIPAILFFFLSLDLTEDIFVVLGSFCFPGSSRCKFHSHRRSIGADK